MTYAAGPRLPARGLRARPGRHPEHPAAVGGLPASKPGLNAGTRDLASKVAVTALPAYSGVTSFHDVRQMRAKRSRGLSGCGGTVPSLVGFGGARSLGLSGVGELGWVGGVWCVIPAALSRSVTAWRLVRLPLFRVRNPGDAANRPPLPGDATASRRRASQLSASQLSASRLSANRLSASPRPGLPEPGSSGRPCR